MDKTKFINLVKQGAIDARKKYGICPSMTIAQAIIESGWGEHAPGNMLFGIKWTKGCGYDKQNLKTQEFYGGSYHTIVAAFRKYKSFSDSILDHADFLVKNGRYKNLLNVLDYKTACKLIQQDGYATSPTYAQSLITIIEQNNLQRFDKNIQDVRIVIKNELPVRKKPSFLCKPYHTYKKGSIVIVEEEKGLWARTNLGWVKSSYLKKKI